MSDVVPKKTGSQAALHIAATLCYLAGAFFVIRAAIMLGPALGGSENRPMRVPLYLTITGALYIVSGFFLRREQRRGGILAVGMIVARLALLAAGGGPYFNMWVVIDVAILVLIAVNWRQLRDSAATAV